MNPLSIFNGPGITCERFGKSPHLKRLPSPLDFMPQYVVCKELLTRLIYFVTSYDNRYIELTRREVNSLRVWNENVCKTLIMVFNPSAFVVQQYTIFGMEDINRKIFSCRKETIDKFLLRNEDFKWYTKYDACPL